MGMATILHARAIVLLATGASKAACVERVRQWAADDGAAGVVPAAPPTTCDIMLDEGRAAERDG